MIEYQQRSISTELMPMGMVMRHALIEQRENGRHPLPVPRSRRS